MASDSGHLELCRFLLQEAPALHSDEDLQLACDQLLGRQIHERTTTKQRRQGTEAIYSLFVQEHSMPAIIDPGDSISKAWFSPAGYKGEHSLLITQLSLQTVLECQPTAFASLPFHRKFSMAVESTGWPVDILSSLLCQRPLDCATATTIEGKTALHWAAAHFGEWLRRSGAWVLLDQRQECLENAERYSDLASQLLTKGARGNVCWRGCSPFVSFLTGLVGPNFHTFHNDRRAWNELGLSQAVRRWGHMITSCGLDVVEYAAVENRVLRIEQSMVSGSETWSFYPTELVVLMNTELAIKIATAVKLALFETRALTVPGAWPVSSRLPNTIFWTPDDLDEKDGIRWTRTKREVLIRSDPYLVPSGSSLPSDSSFTSVENMRATWFRLPQGTQDDCGWLALIAMKAKDREQRGQRGYGRRRAASCPPIWNAATVGMHYVQSWSDWWCCLHKCPLDSRWSFYRLGLLEKISLRRCMHGRCSEGYDKGWHLSWEAWLLDSEEYTSVAKRFAARFHPDHMDLVETAQARATERARLAMAPTKANGRR